MAKEDTQFKGHGVGIRHGQKPICCKFPVDVDAVLRDPSKVSDRSEYIRAAVLAQLQKDGLI